MFYIDLFMKFVQGNLVNHLSMWFPYIPRIFDIIIEIACKVFIALEWKKTQINSSNKNQIQGNEMSKPLERKPFRYVNNVERISRYMHL